MAICVFRIKKCSLYTPRNLSPQPASKLGTRVVEHYSDYIRLCDTSNVTEVSAIANCLLNAEKCFYDAGCLEYVAVYEMKEGERLGVDSPCQVFKISEIDQSNAKTISAPVIYERRFSTMKRSKHKRVEYYNPYAQLKIMRHGVLHLQDGFFDRSKACMKTRPSFCDVDVFAGNRVITERKLGRASFQIYRGAGHIHSFVGLKSRIVSRLQTEDQKRAWKNYQRALLPTLHALTEYFLDENSVLRAGYKATGKPTFACVSDLLLERRREHVRSAQEIYHREFCLGIRDAYASALDLLERTSHEYGCNTCLELPQPQGAIKCLAILKTFRHHLICQFEQMIPVSDALAYWYFYDADLTASRDFPLNFTGVAGLIDRNKTILEGLLNDNIKQKLACDREVLIKVVQRLNIFINYLETKPNLTVKVGNTSLLDFRINSSTVDYSNPQRDPFFQGDPKIAFVRTVDVVDYWMFDYEFKQQNFPHLLYLYDNELIERTWGFGFPMIGGAGYVEDNPTLVPGPKRMAGIFSPHKKKVWDQWQSEMAQHYHGILSACVDAFSILVYADQFLNAKAAKRTKLEEGVPTYSQILQGVPTFPQIGQLSDYKQNAFWNGAHNSESIQEPRAVYVTHWEMDKRPLFSDCSISEDDDGEEEEEEPEEEEEEEDDDDDDDDDDSECEEAPEELKERLPQSRMRVWDNTVHPLTAEEERVEEINYREQVEENLKVAGEWIYDGFAYYSLYANENPTMLKYQDEAHFVIKQVAGQVNPCDNEEDLKKDATDYCVDKAAGLIGKWRKGGKLVKPGSVKPRGIVRGWKLLSGQVGDKNFWKEQAEQYK